MDKEEDSKKQDAAQRYGYRMIYGAWLAIFFALYLFYGDRIERIVNPNPAPQSLLNASGEVEVTLVPNRLGHYLATGKINGHRVEFILDTGASDVNIPKKTAQRLGLKGGYPIHAQTANGTIVIYRITLDSVELGDIKVNHLDGSINPSMEGQQVLLGMSFLKQLDFKQSGRQLVLIQRHP